LSNAHSWKLNKISTLSKNPSDSSYFKVVSPAADFIILNPPSLPLLTFEFRFPMFKAIKGKAAGALDAATTSANKQSDKGGGNVKELESKLKSMEKEVGFLYIQKENDTTYIHTFIHSYIHTFIEGVKAKLLI